MSTDSSNSQNSHFDDLIESFADLSHVQSPTIPSVQQFSFHAHGLPLVEGATGFLIQQSDLNRFSALTKVLLHSVTEIPVKLTINDTTIEMHACNRGCAIIYSADLLEPICGARIGDELSIVINHSDLFATIAGIEASCAMSYHPKDDCLRVKSGTFERPILLRPLGSYRTHNLYNGLSDLLPSVSFIPHLFIRAMSYANRAIEQRSPVPVIQVTPGCIAARGSFQLQCTSDVLPLVHFGIKPEWVASLVAAFGDATKGSITTTDTAVHLRSERLQVSIERLAPRTVQITTDPQEHPVKLFLPLHSLRNGLSLASSLFDKNSTTRITRRLLSKSKHGRRTRTNGLRYFMHTAKAGQRRLAFSMDGRDDNDESLSPFFVSAEWLKLALSEYDGANAELDLYSNHLRINSSDSSLSFQAIVPFSKPIGNSNAK